MTTHELAKLLLDGPNVMVTIDGYEGGTREVKKIDKLCKLHLNINEKGYYGEHEYCIGEDCLNCLVWFSIDAINIPRSM